MKKIFWILSLVLLAVALGAGWQIVSSQVANSLLREDLQYIAVQTAPKIGLAAPRTDDDLRAMVIAQARQHGIGLDPDQITVSHPQDGATSTVILSVDYTSRINLLGTSFTMHFTPTSIPEGR
jgi:hypothetical protein